MRVQYREKEFPLLLNNPPTLADFNRQIKNTLRVSLTITATNGRTNTPWEIDSDEQLNMVIQKFAEKDKIPKFILMDKNMLEPDAAPINSIDHHVGLPGPSKATTVFLPRVVKSLGEGASANVKLIRCAKTGALFAMKKLSNIDDRRKAAREIEAFTTIKSKRIVSLIQAYNEGEYVKLVMEYMPGGSLHSVISEGNRNNASPPLSWDLIQKYARELLEGVEVIHAAGYVHMDIKPLNLLIDIDGSLKITDFGSFTKVGSEDYSCDLTPMYASPEALAKHSPWQGSTDIWSAGVTILEMILGRIPWSTVSKQEMPLRVFSMMDDIIRNELSDATPPPLLRKILENSLVVDPAQRSSASQLLSLLEMENEYSLR